jgi:Pentapeptide repeats (8 copies)
MAIEEHVTKLKEGAAAWNPWRIENPDIRPYLRGASLTGANLTGANLSKAELRRADLRKADLQRGTLIGADLTDARTTGSGKWPGNVTRCPIGKAPAPLCRRSTSMLAMSGHYFRSAADASRANEIATWRVYWDFEVW